MIDIGKLEEVNELAFLIEKACEASSIHLIKTANTRNNLGMTPLLALALVLNDKIDWEVK